MPYEVQEPTIELHEENKFFVGSIISVIEEDGQYGKQLKWVLALDDDGTYVDDDGNEVQRTVWHWCPAKLTTSDKSKFRKIVKGLTGKEPQPGELFDERHWTEEWYRQHPDADPVALTGIAQPWRVAVMFEHGKKADGSPKETVSILISESRL